MTMTKYTDIEIQTAKNLLKEGYKWIARDESEGLSAYTDKPIKLNTFWCSDGNSNCVCDYVPIFQSVRFGDKEPVSLESIVHPQILDDAEKKYLSAVIKPFRESVSSIEKSDIYRDEAICINTEKRYMVFPPFKAGTMYKGMELNRMYTLEELGL